MSITIDRAGRIVVAKALRERFGLHPGTELEIEEMLVHTLDFSPAI